MSTRGKRRTSSFASSWLPLQTWTLGARSNPICDYLNWDDYRVATAAEFLRFPEFEHFKPTSRQSFVIIYAYYVLYFIVCFVFFSIPILVFRAICIFDELIPFRLAHFRCARTSNFSLEITTKLSRCRCHSRRVAAFSRPIRFLWDEESCSSALMCRSYIFVYRSYIARISRQTVFALSMPRVPRLSYSAVFRRVNLSFIIVRVKHMFTWSSTL